MVQAETFDGNIQINRYDAEGLRAEMEENGRISGFVFDGKNVVAEETDEDVIRYIRGDRILASDSEHARTYYHYVGDELGSIIHVIQGEEGYFDKEESESQERIQSEDRILNRYAYDAFGNRTVCEEKIANRFGYAGEMYDGITQQYYLRARFYNPIIGRFTQEDTYYGDGLNLYEYGRNNPVRYIDPSGHEVRAAAEKNYVNRAVDAMNKAADQGVNGMLERVYGDKGGLKSGLSPSKINEIVSIPKGNRPDPASYLSKTYIDAHLAQFDDGASIIMTREQYITYVKGNPNIGIPSDGTQFVMPKNFCDEIATNANGSISVYEKALGFDDGHFADGGGLIRIDIDNLAELNLRIPSGNEAGANSHWIPGGKTDGGVSEAVTDLVPNNLNNVTITEIN